MKILFRNKLVFISAIVGIQAILNATYSYSSTPAFGTSETYPPAPQKKNFSGKVGYSFSDKTKIIDANKSKNDECVLISLHDNGIQNKIGIPKAMNIEMYGNSAVATYRSNFKSGNDQLDKRYNQTYKIRITANKIMWDGVLSQQGLIPLIKSNYEGANIGYLQLKTPASGSEYCRSVPGRMCPTTVVGTHYYLFMPDIMLKAALEFTDHVFNGETGLGYSSEVDGAFRRSYFIAATRRYPIVLDAAAVIEKAEHPPLELEVKLKYRRAFIQGLGEELSKCN